MNAKLAVQTAIQNKEKWERSHYIGASEINKCPLDLYFSKTEDDGFRGNGKTERGHAIEVALIQLLKKGGIDIRYHAGHVDHQKELTHDEYPVTCHPDGIIYQDKQQIAVLEVKSVGTDAFRRLYEPQESWVIQSRFNAYMALLPTALLVAVDASDFENVKEWEFEAMTHFEAEQYLHKSKKIMSAIELEIEPIAEPSVSNCRWCSWVDRCQNTWVPDEEAKVKEVEIDDLKPALETLSKAKEMQTEAKEMEKSAKAAIMNAAKSHDAARLRAGQFIAILEPRKGRVSLDAKKLFVEHPEIDKADYEKQGAASVALKLKEL